MAQRENVYILAAICSLFWIVTIQDPLLLGNGAWEVKWQFSVYLSNFWTYFDKIIPNGGYWPTQRTNQSDFGGNPGLLVDPDHMFIQQLYWAPCVREVAAPLLVEVCAVSAVIL